MTVPHKTLAAVTFALLAGQVSAAEKITIMVGGMEKQIYLPAKLAEQLGYLKETGLDIELLSEPAGVAHGVATVIRPEQGAYRVARGQLVIQAGFAVPAVKCVSDWNTGRANRNKLAVYFDGPDAFEPQRVLVDTPQKR